MHIVIIPAFFRTNSRPTLGSFFWDQAKALRKEGHKVTILYCDTYSVKCVGEYLSYQEETELTEDGITIYRDRSFCVMKHGMEGHKERFAKGINKLWEKYLSKEKVDIIHAHCAVWAGYSAMLLSAQYNIPYVVTEHATLFQLHRDDISVENNRVIKQIFQNADKVVCVSKAFSKLLSDYRTDIEVIGNVVDCDMFRPQKQEKNHNFEFLTVCYMQEEAQLYKKGIDILIKAFAKVIEKYPDTRLMIGGGGKAKDKVEAWCVENKVSDNVNFLGNLGRDQVAEQMNKCDCFVLPSRYETFGVVYIEAFACGKPVIATKNGGPDEFVKDFNGKLIENEDVDKLVDAMCEMIERYSEYDPSQIREYVESNYSEKAIGEKLTDLYMSWTGEK